MQKTVVPLLALFTLFSCAPVRFVKPLEKKQSAVGVSLGGPLIDFSNITIPMPLVSASYGYGIDSTLTGFGGINLTSAIYGNAQVDLGVTKQLLKQDGYRPALSITPVANFIYRNKDAKKLYPQLDISAFWEYNRKKDLVYAGLSNWFELSSQKSYGQDQPHHWLLTPLVGQTFVRKKGDFTIEAKVLASNIYYKSNVVDYKSPFGKNGAFGIYFGYTRKF
jgi:hypothetical protein